MKFWKFVLLVLLVTSCATTKTSSYYLDENDKSISQEDFLNKWRNKETGLARWDSQNDTARIAKLSHPIIEQYVLDYGPFIDNLERMTGKTFSDSTTLVLEYVYMNDLCNSDRNNSWSKREIRKRKNFLTPIKTKVEEQNDQLVFLHFFEEGIELANDPASPEEYFYTDTKNFLRNSIFKNPTLCGSYALVKPNGQVLVRNGESRPEWIAEYLKDEYWEVIFPTEAEE